jgi:hypothetical protein
MRRAIARVAILSLPILLVLLSFGLATALWPEALVVQGSVSAAGSGRSGPVWFFRSCDDPEAEGKDVATWAVEPNGRDQTALRMRVNNAYPGYQVYCELHLANGGNAPVEVTGVNVLNPNPQALTVTAQEDPAQASKVLRPCGSTPAWGTRPSHVPAQCRTEVQLTLQVEPGAAENSRYGFSVEVRVEQVP